MIGLCVAVNVPLSDVSVIAGVLGALFVFIALYKGMFHKRRAPEDAALEAMEAQRKKEAEAALRVSLASPYDAPKAEPAPEPESPAPTTETKSATAAPLESAAKPAPSELTTFSAFRQMTAGGVVGQVNITQHDVYQWE